MCNERHKDWFREFLKTAHPSGVARSTNDWCVYLDTLFNLRITDAFTVNRRVFGERFMAVRVTEEL